MTSQPHKTDGVSTAKLGTSRGDDLNKRQKEKNKKRSWVGKERGNDSLILRTNHQRYTEPYHLFFFFICNKFKKLKGKRKSARSHWGRRNVIYVLVSRMFCKAYHIKKPQLHAFHEHPKALQWLCDGCESQSSWGQVHQHPKAAHGAAWSAG